MKVSVKSGMFWVGAGVGKKIGRNSEEQTMWNKKRIVWFVLMMATMAVIFYFSGQNGEKSNEVGNVVAQTMNITPSVAWIDESHTKLLFGLTLRKWAHVGLFGFLGLTASGWILSLPKAMLICLAYSILDEVHQYFVPGREAKAMDIVIDAIGFVAVIVLIGVVRTIRKSQGIEHDKGWRVTN